MSYNTARESTRVNRLYNQAGPSGEYEIPFDGKDIRFLRITNILTVPLTLDIYLEARAPTAEQFFICKDILVLNGSSLEFTDDDIFLSPGYKLMVRTPLGNSFSAIYRLK
tara:strand:+ start:16527 stop:16856 length:330 start_codon:yes stop_codon:yes gene_type:complete